MFTGLIEEVGRVLWVRASEQGTELHLTAPAITGGLKEGDSVSVNGCCLTVAAIRGDRITFDLLAETLARTNLRLLRPESPVNLERALAANSRIGGHFVQGHIDCCATAIDFQQKAGDHRLEVQLPNEFAYLAAFKGSIAINGISLTIAEIFAASFVVWIIPHTRRNTNLETLQSGDIVNLEFDILAKYVARMLPRPVE